MDNIDLRIRQVMSDVFEVSVDSITLESSQDTVEMWDSLRHLDLIVALEEEFNVSIPVEEVGNLITFKLISFVIKDLVNNN